ncbi:MAG TPA: hypothetical protein VK957_03435 [Lunatimonas sp.]|nr:hypothetical protein [Lunatimonas sp.]
MEKDHQIPPSGLLYKVVANSYFKSWDLQDRRSYKEGVLKANYEFDYESSPYDQDFKVFGETKIEGLNQIPESYFWKGGKLWSYVNIEDELGFAVIDFKF